MLGWNIQLLGSMGPSNLCFGFQVRDKVGLDLACAFSPRNDYSSSVSYTEILTRRS